MEIIIEQPKKKRKVLRIVGWVLGVLLLIIGGLLLYGNAYTKKSLPQLNGEIALSGLQEPVTVIRDEKGVPHITAKSEQDLFMAQGYVQAQDRLFQMDLSRRQASGMLSEVVGDVALPRDKFFRTFGLRRAAEISLATYSDYGKQVLQWYADGVNAYMKEATDSGKLPVEFKILGYKPTEWTPVDSLAIGKYMAYDLGGHWDEQAFRQWAVGKFSKEKAKELFASYPTNAPRIIDEAKKAAASIDIEKSFALADIKNPWNGSNDWVVSGSKSESGKPLLADDPHLGLATPSVWYQLQLKAPNVNVEGVIFAGVPGVILGHNEHVAWGVTNTGPDVQDLFIEKRNPDNPNQFLHNGKWEDAKVIDEPIKVKGGETVPYKVTITRHGPVISEFAYKSKDNTVLAMQWTALEASKELEAVLNFNKAKNWTEFEKALEDFHSPTQNFVFASNDGTIAYKANGKIPIRKGDGQLPVPGWTDEYDWTGYIPYDKLPRIVNPPAGFIATANNKVIDDSYPYHITDSWAQPYRYMRIEQVLKSKEKLSAKDMEALQMDQQNLYAEEFLQKMLSHVDTSTELEKSGLTILKDWKMKDDKDEAAPLIFNLWMDSLPKYLFDKDIPENIQKLIGNKRPVVDEMLRKALAGNEGVWFKEQGGTDKVLTNSYKKIIEKISRDYGSDSAKWKWGDFHQLYFAHPLSSSVSALKPFFNNIDPISIGGSRVTVQAAGYNDKGLVNHGASWRFVIDTADMTTGNHIVGPGESGHFRSEWYDNQIKDWANGTYHQTSLNPTANPDTTLTLKPSK